MADDSNLEMPSRGESRVANLVFYGVAIVLESLTRASHDTIKDAPFPQSEQTCQCPTSCRCCHRAKYTSMMSVCISATRNITHLPLLQGMIAAECDVDFYLYGRHTLYKDFQR